MSENNEEPISFRGGGHQEVEVTSLIRKGGQQNVRNGGQQPIGTPNEMVRIDVTPEPPPPPKKS